MPLKVTIASELAKEKGTFKATGVVTAPDGSEKGKATVYVSTSEGGVPTLVLPKDTKSTILGNEVTEYKSYTFDGEQAALELAKDVELTFSGLTFAI